MKNLSQKEAITILESMRVNIPVPKAAETQIKRNVALDMAINALNCSEIPNNSDTISRQAAIDIIWSGVSLETYEDKEYVEKLLCELPVQPQTGQAEPLELQFEQVGTHIIKTCPTCNTPWRVPPTSEYLKIAEYPCCPCGQRIRWERRDE